eukprot:266395_1
MARMEPRYERNLPKLCSFFAKGECNRGSLCPFRHEMPKDRNDPLAKQNTKDRFYGSNDPVAAKMIWKKKQIEEQRRAERIAASGGKDGEAGDERAVATCYIRFDTRNESTMNIMISESDLRDQFYSHGEIVSVRMHQSVGAFIEYTTGQAAELAIITMNHKQINGRKILVSWARQPKRGNHGQGQSQNSGNGGVQGPIQPKAPPGSSSLKIPGAGITCLPAGFAPSAQVTAAVKSRATINAGLAKTGLSASLARKLPRPSGGGGPIRRIGGAGLRNAAPKPYYPSSDPTRLGTNDARDN